MFNGSDIADWVGGQLIAWVGCCLVLVFMIGAVIDAISIVYFKGG